MDAGVSGPCGALLYGHMWGELEGHKMKLTGSSDGEYGALQAEHTGLDGPSGPWRNTSWELSLKESGQHRLLLPGE